MKVTFDIRGNKELMANLATLPQKMEKKVIAQAVRATQKIMVPVAQSNARTMLANSKYPDGRDMSELIAKNIVVRAAKKQKRGLYTINVMMRPKVGEFLWYPKGSSSSLSDKETTGRGTYIPAAIEYGHMAGSTYVPPVSFMRSAAESTKDKRMEMFTNLLRSGLLRNAIVRRTGIDLSMVSAGL